jgi:hypothetical protein
MKKFLEKIDFLYKGDRDMLILMWASIFLAILTILDLVITIRSIT